MLKNVRLLLIDTCGEIGSLALAEDKTVVAGGLLSPREASVAFLPVLQGLLNASGWKLRELDGVAVVSGPGSFTGLRVGMAAAKGLCEATGLPLVALSRLDVLAESAGLSHGFAVLDAGRGFLFVRFPDAREVLMKKTALRELLDGDTRLIVGEERLLSEFADRHAEFHAVTASDALPVVLRALPAGTLDAALIDANYVRGEQDIYAKTPRPGDSG